MVSHTVQLTESLRHKKDEDVKKAIKNAEKFWDEIIEALQDYTRLQGLVFLQLKSSIPQKVLLLDSSACDCFTSC